MSLFRSNGKNCWRQAFTVRRAVGAQAGELEFVLLFSPRVSVSSIILPYSEAGFGAFSKERMTVAFKRKDGRDGMSMPKKVLIVEDNELNMKLFHDLLDAAATRPCRPATAWRRSISRASTGPT